MGFKDIFKNSVLKMFDTTNLSAASILTTLAIAILMGLFIFYIYRITSRNGLYNRSFNKVLAAMPVITATIMLAMQSNLIISLGMVGALSIVRFRNAVKDASDLTYLFWSISSGIVIGTGLFKLAFLSSLCITLLIFGLEMVPMVKTSCLLVVSGTPDCKTEALMAPVKQHCSYSKIRSQNVTSHGTEWIVEVRVKESEALIQALSSTEGITSINLLTHDGDVRY